jgi:hypothetical protein
MVEQTIPSERTAPCCGSSLNSNATLPLWLRIMVLIGTALLTAGAVISAGNPALLVSPHAEINPAVHVYASYTFSRDLALAIMLLVALRLRARATLNTLMLLVGFIQILDAFTDCVDHRWTIVPGTLVIGLVFFLGAASLSGSPFWKVQGWKQVS